MTSTDTYQLKWHSHSSHLNGSVAALLRSERFTDVVLCTMDGSQIPAHKFILSSCSVYLSNLFEGQRSVTRMGGMLYVVLPSEISTKALKILVEYMYKGETTVSNEVLDTVLKAGEVLKIRGLWRQTDEAGGDSTPAEKTTTPNNTAIVNKQQVLPVKKPEEVSKIAIKKDDKLLKTFGQVQQGQNVTRPMFIGPPKLVFIKTTEGGTQAALHRTGSTGQTILVTQQAPQKQPETTVTSVQSTTPTPTITVAPTTITDDSSDEAPPPRILRRHANERKYGKKQKTDSVDNDEKDKEEETTSSSSSKKPNQANNTMTEITVKDEPEWDASSIEEEERSIAEMFQAEMSVKTEPVDEMDIEEESLIYSPWRANCARKCLRCRPRGCATCSNTGYPATTPGNGNTDQLVTTLRKQWHYSDATFARSTSRTPPSGCATYRARTLNLNWPYQTTVSHQNVTIVSQRARKTRLARIARRYFPRTRLCSYICAHIQANVHLSAVYATKAST